jgi:hypothetical protein
MSLKLSPGCTCCDEEGCSACTGTTPTEMDMTFAGFYNNDFAGGMCSDCETTLDGTYSLAWDGMGSGGCTWIYRASDPPTDAFATCDSGQYEWWICFLKLSLTTEECDQSPPSSNLNWKFQAQFNYLDTNDGSKGSCFETHSASPLIGYGTIAATPHTFDCSAVSNFTIDNICLDPVAWWTWCWWDSTTLDVKVSAG